MFLSLKKNFNHRLVQILIDKLHFLNLFSGAKFTY